jgi:glutaredoxin 3
MPEIEIYSTDYCGYCWRAKSLLESKGLPYTEINATKPDVRAAMMKRSNGYRSVPQIFIGGEFIGGSDELAALERSGKLDPMLQAG